jgi:RimJ/RimL family protein N-acetyltransferase
MRIEISSGYIRPWEAKDLPVLLRCFTQEVIRKNLRSTNAYPLQVLRNPTHFAIVIQNETMGGIGFDLDSKHHKANLGFWIDQAHSRKGIMSEVLPLICRWFHPFHLDYTIQATVYGWNPVSQKVLEKSGFTQVARLPNAIRYSDEVTDLLIYEWDTLADEIFKKSIRK